jgi:hypothetical protein
MTREEITGRKNGKTVANPNKTERWFFFFEKN